MKYGYAALHNSMRQSGYNSMEEALEAAKAEIVELTTEEYGAPWTGKEDFIFVGKSNLDERVWIQAEEVLTNINIDVEDEFGIQNFIEPEPGSVEKLQALLAEAFRKWCKEFPPSYDFGPVYDFHVYTYDPKTILRRVEEKDVPSDVLIDAKKAILNPLHHESGYPMEESL